MDKQLKQLKTQYESDIPTTFTEHDKQAVFQKIKQADNKQKAKIFPFYPKALVGIVVAAAIFLLVVTINNIPDLSMSSEDQATESSSSGDASRISQDDKEMNTMENAKVAEEESREKSYDMGIAMDTVNQTFDPNGVRIGSTYGNMEVIEVDQDGESKTIVFYGETRINGYFQFEGDKLSFIPDETSNPVIPLAVDDEVADVGFYFENEGFVKMVKNISDDPSLLDTNQGHLLEVNRLVYNYSPNGSTIELEISNTVSNTYETGIELSEELLSVYGEYKASLDDGLLKGLTPMDVFKLYFHAKQNEDEEVVYALYIQDNIHGTPEKDDYFNDPFYEEAETMKENARELYQGLLNVEVFEEEYASSEEAVIRFTTDTTDHFFRLIKDRNSDVWKVGWLPMQ